MKIVTLLVLLGLTGCGTILNGTRQSIAIKSSVPAEVTVRNLKTNRVDNCSTPCFLNLHRKGVYSVDAVAPGKNGQAMISRRASWVLLGNLVLGGPIGALVDVVSGGGFTLKPDQVDIDLKSE